MPETLSTPVSAPIETLSLTPWRTPSSPAPIRKPMIALAEEPPKCTSVRPGAGAVAVWSGITRAGGV